MQAQARSTPSISELAPGDRRVLNENEVANRWGVSPKTLQRWRSEGRGPKYLKLSKRVGYPLESVIDFERTPGAARLHLPARVGVRWRP